MSQIALAPEGILLPMYQRASPYFMLRSLAHDLLKNVRAHDADTSTHVGTIDVQSVLIARGWRIECIKAQGLMNAQGRCGWRRTGSKTKVPSTKLTAVNGC